MKLIYLIVLCIEAAFGACTILLLAAGLVPYAIPSMFVVITMDTIRGLLGRNKSAIYPHSNNE